MKTDNTPRKTRVGILFGGKSAEHDVSIQSALNVVEALDKSKFEAVPVYIDRQGLWHACAPSDMHGDLAQLEHSSPLTLVPGSTKRQLIAAGQAGVAIDVIFPVLHGPLGEDGAVQGFLELANVPYVGPGVLGSAIGMDKDVMKRLLRERGIPVARSVVAHRFEQAIDLNGIVSELGLPLFVKPANMGSSIGVSKATSKSELAHAIEAAFRYDEKILIEAAIVGDEVECAVLGNDHPEVSIPGRVVTGADFYDYQEKYQETGLTSIEIPAKLPEQLAESARQTALGAFRALECEGMTRVDMFVTKTGEVLVNEINTIPGFTRFSMYPKLWEASGLKYADLITRLLDLAVERFDRRQSMQRVVPAKTIPE